MKARVFLIGVVAFGLLLGSGIGHATESHSCSNLSHSCTASDTNNCTVEPILTRSDAAKVTTCDASLAPNKLSDANVKSYSISATGGNITAVVNLQGPFIHDTITAADPTNGVLPYSGQHVLIMFQTKDFETDQVIGKGATGDDVHWVPPGYNADHFRWFVYAGWNATEQRDLCGLGYYDPTGELAPPVPVFFGQTFFIIGQPGALNVLQPTIKCTLSNGDKTLTIAMPYVYGYSDRTGQFQRHLTVVKSGETMQNTSAFTWLDHEIGGPDPIGLILGWTWYTDAVPTSSYKYGLIAGDPNPSVFATPKCLTNPDPNPVTGEPAGPCTIDNPVGTGFNNTGYSFVAG